MIEFLIEIDGRIHEISELVKSVSYTDKLNDGCSKLEFSYVDDSLNIQNGRGVKFKYDDTNVFCGYVFKHGQNKKKEISITAYDQLRYCKAKDSINVINNKASDVVKRMCVYFGLKQGNITDTQYVLPSKTHDGDTWLDIVYSAIKDTNVNKGVWYSLRDEFGDVALRNLTELQLTMVLGDRNLCYDFEYEKSIDDEFYNQVKLLVKCDKENKSVFAGKNDPDSIKKFGMLQYYGELDGSKYNQSQANVMAEELLKLYNREVETLTLNCLGDVRVRAGSSFYGSIEDIELNKRLIVRSVTHDFLPVHTMTVEVAI